MLLYFGGHTISANRTRMAPQKLNGTIGLHQDKESIEVNLEMFFLFVSVKSELCKFYPGTFTGIVAVRASNVGKIRCTRMANSFVYRAKSEHERRMTTLNSYFLVRN